MGRAFTRAAIGALVVAAASVTGVAGVIVPAAAADPGAACITATEARFGGDWNPGEPSTLEASLKGERGAALCDDVVLNVSVYALPATWNVQGWNPTAAPQTLIFHGQDLVFPKGATAGTVLTTTVASVPCVDFQIDLYRGAKLDRVTYPDGHGSGYLAGGLVEVEEESPRCAPPTAPPATMPPSPSTTPSMTASTTESTSASTTTSSTSSTNSASTTTTTQVSTAPGTSATASTSATKAPATSTTSTTAVAATATTTGPTTAVTRPTPAAAGLAFTGASDGLVRMTVAGVVLLLGGAVAMGLVATRRQRARHQI